MEFDKPASEVERSPYQRPTQKRLGASAAIATIGCCAVVASNASVAAESYPTRPIRIVDGFAAGGGTDIMARQIGQKLSERLNQPVVVENRPGAGGTLGAEVAARATPDGHTLFMAVNTSLAPSVSLRSLSFDVMKDFAFITFLASGTYVVIVNPALPARTISELIALAKSRPGKLRYGSTGVGGPAHLAGELFKSRAGVDILHVAYKGSPPIFAAIASDEVQISYLNAASVLPMIKAGRLRGLAVTAAKRVNAAPDIPTVAESGVPGYDVTPWYGLVTTAGTPAAVVSLLHDEIGKILQLPEIQSVFARQGLEVKTSTPEQFRQAMQAEIDKWGKVIKDAGIKVQ
jgi:tripartite-type tricarboxylate transporter receptor subunit TctC